MFEKAVRMKLRFNYKGLCSVEDLWDLPVTSLDSIYKELNKRAKTEKEESLLDKRTKADDLLDLQIGIVKHIVKTKLKEQEDRENAAMKREKKQKLLSIMAEKQDKALYDMPLEDLEKMVNDLG